MLSFFSTVIWFLAAIVILVTIHEYGHYLVARLCGVKVLRFSVGFGPRLLTYAGSNGTEFAISAIPLGGYVKMLDERVEDVDESEHHMAFNRKSVWQRIAIAAAGPFANILLAFVLFWLIFLRGTTGYTPVVGVVQPSSPAALAGIESGQQIVSVDGIATASRRDVRLALIDRLGESGSIDIGLKYEDSDNVYKSPVNIVSWLSDVNQPNPLEALGIGFYRPEAGTVISSVVPDSAARRSGFEAGDRVLSANGGSLNSWAEWVSTIQDSAGKSLSILVERNGRELTLTLIPDAKTVDGVVMGFAGVGGTPVPMPAAMIIREEYSAIDALGASVAETQSAVALVFLSLKKLLVGEISVKNLSGPIGIAKVTADHARHSMWAFVEILAQLSVMLAVLNILPLPVLDGGHILFCLVEWVKGRPLSEKAQEWGVKAGMAVLLTMMIVAFYNDLLRL
ncbi:MAG: regulator of sigma E protease [Flavobacteriales bacterium]|jgi:regulator of sigma E protease